MADERHMTRESFKRLQAEIKRLEEVEMPRVAHAIGTAAQEGDLSENAEYHAAREEQGHLKARIDRLKERERLAVIVEAVGNTIVGIGSTVSWKDLKLSGTQTFRIVASHEANPTAGTLSSESPVAVALRGHKKGDTVKVSTPSGERLLQIVKITS